VFVKMPVPVLSPLLRSDAQGELLALLFLRPDEEFSLSEIARRVGVSLPTVHAEIGRLVASGLILERRLGQARLVRANPEHILARPLTELLELTYGPVAVLPQVLADLNGVREAYVYGSWAARRLGEPGPAPRDLDVVVIGSPTRAQLVEASLVAGRRLHREVNITRIAPAVWDAGDDLFVRTLTSRPLVRLDLETAHGDANDRPAKGRSAKEKR
jgi:DNA-binding transcriptional ArsR family regulator